MADSLARCSHVEESARLLLQLAAEQREQVMRMRARGLDQSALSHAAASRMRRANQLRHLARSVLEANDEACPAEACEGLAGALRLLAEKETALALEWVKLSHSALDEGPPSCIAAAFQPSTPSPRAASRVGRAAAGGVRKRLAAAVSELEVVERTRPAHHTERLLGLPASVFASGQGRVCSEEWAESESSAHSRGRRGSGRSQLDWGIALASESSMHSKAWAPATKFDYRQRAWHDGTMWVFDLEDSSDED